MNKTKEEILKETAINQKIAETNIIKETAEIIYKTLNRGQEQNSTSIINAIEQRINDCFVSHTTHLTDQIKSMENYISDVDGQVKELRDENEIQGNYNDMLIKELESLQKENAKLTIILSADNSDKLDLENKVKEYEELMMDLEDSYMDWIDAEGTQNDGRFSVEVNNIRIKAKALTN